jgi:hypothetical protein
MGGGHFVIASFFRPTDIHFQNPQTVSNLPNSFTRSRKQSTPVGFSALSWAAMMLAVAYGIQPVWNTFIHQWKPELFGAVLLLGVLGYVLATRGDLVSNSGSPSTETRCISSFCRSAG